MCETRDLKTNTFDKEGTLHVSESHVGSGSIYMELIQSSWCLEVALRENKNSSSIKNKLNANCNSSNMIHIGLRELLMKTNPNKEQEMD